MIRRPRPVFADRYDAHVLRTPAEVRNALRYVVGNFASHAARRGEPMRDGWVDPFSSAVVKVPRMSQGGCSRRRRRGERRRGCCGMPEEPAAL